MKLCIHATFRSCYYSYRKIDSTFCIIPRILSTVPPKVPKALLRDPPWCKLIELADPAVGGQLDALVGSMDSYKCTTGAPLTSNSVLITAIPTIFGWSIVAPVDHERSQPVFRFNLEKILYSSLQSACRIKHKFHKNPA